MGKEVEGAPGVSEGPETDFSVFSRGRIGYYANLELISELFFLSNQA